MSVEEKVKREILIKELAKDELLAHCFLKIEDAMKLFCGTYLAIACAEAHPCQWGTLSIEHRRCIARFAVQAIWPQISREDQDEWLEIVEAWAAVVVKKKGLTIGDAASAMLGTSNIKAMAKKLGISYDVVYRRIIPKIAPFETIPKLQPIFDTRTPHQKTLEHLQEPRRIFKSRVLDCAGAIGIEVEKAKAAFYEWYENFPERKDYPSFDLKALEKSRTEYFDKHGTVAGWRSVIPHPDE